MYLTNTTPDTCFEVNILSQYMVNPKHIHLIGANHVMRYLKGNLDYGLKYASSGEIKLHGYADSNLCRSAKYRKSTSGCCFSLGSGMISWFSRKQTSIALSIAKEEYIAPCSSCCEAVWL